MTEAKLAANRANARHSTGPVTPEGKSASSANSTKHGLTSRRVVLPGESEDEYAAFTESFFRHFKPVGDIEADLVREIAAARWRLRRAESLESELIEDEMDRLAADTENPIDDSRLLARAFRNLSERNGALAQLHRHESRLRRTYEKAVRELKTLQWERPAATVPTEVQNEATAPTAGHGVQRATSVPDLSVALESALFEVPGRSTPNHNPRL